VSDTEDLSGLQAWMAEALRRRRSLEKYPELAETTPRHVTGNDRLTPIEQLDVYRRQFWLRHTGALLEDFPGLSGVLGQNDWERLVEEYLEATAPASWTLRDLGDRLPAFVESAGWLPHHSLCVDMARLEWAYVELFDAAEPELLDPERLRQVPDDAWAGARLAFSPALRLLRVSYPVAELRRRLRAGEPDVPIPPEEAQCLVLWRDRQRTLRYEVVGTGAFELLAGLLEGLSLARAAERAIERVPEQAAGIEASLGAWFEEWARRGYVVDVIV
jgi:hypothetical protein